MYWQIVAIKAEFKTQEVTITLIKTLFRTKHSRFIHNITRKPKAFEYEYSAEITAADECRRIFYITSTIAFLNTSTKLPKHHILWVLLTKNNEFYEVTKYSQVIPWCQGPELKPALPFTILMGSPQPNMQLVLFSCCYLQKTWSISFTTTYWLV